MVFEATSSSQLMWTYFGSFLGYALVLAMILGGFVWMARRNPQMLALLSRFGIRPVVAVSPSSQSQLHVVESLPLEPQKTLYVVRYGPETFLLASGVAETHFLTRLGDPHVMEALRQGAQALAPMAAEQMASQGGNPGAGSQFFRSLKEALPKAFPEQTQPGIHRPANRPNYDHPPLEAPLPQSNHPTTPRA